MTPILAVQVSVVLGGMVGETGASMPCLGYLVGIKTVSAPNCIGLNRWAGVDVLPNCMASEERSSGYMPHRGNNVPTCWYVRILPDIAGVGQWYRVWTSLVMLCSGGSVVCGRSGLLGTILCDVLPFLGAHVLS